MLSTTGSSYKHEGRTIAGRPFFRPTKMQLLDPRRRIGMLGRLFFCEFGGRKVKSFPERFRKMRWTSKANGMSNRGNVWRVLPQQLTRFPEPQRTYEITRRTPCDCLQFSVQVHAAEACFLRRNARIKIGIAEMAQDDPDHLLQKFIFLARQPLLASLPALRSERLKRRTGQEIHDIKWRLQPCDRGLRMKKEAYEPTHGMTCG